MSGPCWFLRSPTCHPPPLPELRYSTLHSVFWRGEDPREQRFGPFHSFAADPGKCVVLGVRRVDDDFHMFARNAAIFDVFQHLLQRHTPLSAVINSPDLVVAQVPSS